MGKEGLFVLNFVDHPNPLIYCHQPNTLKGNFAFLLKMADSSSNGQGLLSPVEELDRLSLPVLLTKIGDLKQRDITDFYKLFTEHGGFYHPDVRRTLATIIGRDLTFFFDNQVESSLILPIEIDRYSPRGLIYCRNLLLWGILGRQIVPTLGVRIPATLGQT